MSKPVILNCYTDKPYVFNFAKLVKPAEAIPSWWKALPKVVSPPKYPGIEMPTMKLCEGFSAQYKKGFFIPLWSDLAIQVAQNGVLGHSWMFADGMSNAEEHPEIQRGSYLPAKHYQHLKISVPWLFKCEEAVDWQLLGANWNSETPEDFITPPGIINFKFQHGANVNIFIRKEQQSKILRLSHGQLLAQLVPLTERKVIINTHLISEEAFKQMTQEQVTIKFVGTYKRIKELLSQSCPFKG